MVGGMSLIYLAQPYTGTEEEMNYRYEMACKVTARLIMEGLFVFSPISHGHGPARFGLPKEFSYWEDYCELMIPKCNEIYLLTLDGWHKSVGVKAELQLAEQLGISVRTIEP